MKHEENNMDEGKEGRLVVKHDEEEEG